MTRVEVLIEKDGVTTAWYLTPGDNFTIQNVPASVPVVINVIDK